MGILKEFFGLRKYDFVVRNKRYTDKHRGGVLFEVEYNLDMMPIGDEFTVTVKRVR